MRKLLTLICVISISLVCVPNIYGQKAKMPKNKKVDLPLQGRKYETNKKFFRATASGVSTDLATAKKIAIHNAKTDLVKSIETTMKVVTSQYIDQKNLGSEGEDYASHFEEMSREVANQTIGKVDILEEKVTFNKRDGRYTYWVAVETSSDGVAEKIGARAAADKKASLAYDKEQYMKIFDTEMEKYGE